ncbi:MAG: hypothetical protein JWQ53_2480 [Klenkia sp.]|nr:hypothetical protein [Klenkia sp.]
MGAHPAVAHLLLGVLVVHVVDPVLEVPEEPDRVQVLPDEVAGVPVEPEGLAVPDRLHGGDRRPVVVGDLRGVHLVGEPDAGGVELVEHRVPAVGEIAVAGLDHRGGHRREHRHGLPDRGPGEPHDGVHAQRPGGVRGRLHLLGRAAADALGVAVPPHPRVDHVAVPLVDRVVADRLAVEVVADREHRQPVLLEQVLPPAQVGLVLGGPDDVEVVAPAGDLQAVVAPARGQPADLGEGQVGPLAGEQGDGAGHQELLGEQGTGVQTDRSAALRWTASSTRCTASPSAKEGVGCSPAPSAPTRSTTWWVNACS